MVYLWLDLCYGVLVVGWIYVTVYLLDMYYVKPSECLCCISFKLPGLMGNEYHYQNQNSALWGCPKDL